MSPHDLALDRRRVALLLVDLQERLAAAMDPAALERVQRNVVVLVEGAKLLDLPVVVTEQYPQGLGPTLAPIREALPPGTQPFAKVDFSCAKVPEVMDELRRLGRDQIVVAGMETHICVFQSARDLLASGRRVHVLHDAVLSRAEENRRVGLELIGRAGAAVTATETVLFDLLGRAGSDEFRAISRLVK